MITFQNKIQPAFNGKIIRTTDTGKEIVTPSLVDGDRFILGFIQGSIQNKLLKDKDIDGNKFMLGKAKGELTKYEGQDTIIITSTKHKAGITKLYLNLENVDATVKEYFSKILNMLKQRLEEAASRKK
ncbi:MAG: hypothetical protein AB1782_12370 [Cyanobacteriota bacterium]